MRNLKKILALVLALVMSMSLLATANAFEDEKDIDAKFDEAVEVLNALKVFQGYDEGKTFKPQGEITRAEVAAIIYRIVTGDTADKQVKIYSDYNKFDDVKSGSWYAGYVNFCANAEIIKGYSATKFGPNDTVTGYQALAMILRAIGYDKNGEFTGAGWQVQTAAVAKKLNITKNITAGTLGLPATREMVAEILFRTIAYAPQVDYTLAFGYTDRDLTGENDTLGEETFGLVQGDRKNIDKWGRPGYDWYATKIQTKALCTIEEAFIVDYVTAVKECDLASTLELDETTTYPAYINGVNAKGAANAKVTVEPTDVINSVGAQGRLTEVYEDRIVMIDTYLAEVTDVVAARYDAAGHLWKQASMTLRVYDAKNSGYTDVTIYADSDYSYVKGDYVLVNAYTQAYNNAKIATKAVTTTVNTFVAYDILGLADSITGAQTNVWMNAAQHTVDGTTYDDANTYYKDAAGTNAFIPYTWFFDNNGNLIGSAIIAEQYTYAILKDIIWNVGTPGYATATLIDAATGEESVVTVNKIDGDAADAFNWDALTATPMYSVATANYKFVTGDPNYAYVGNDSVLNNNYLGYALYRVQTLSTGAVNLIGKVADTTIVNYATDVDIVKGGTWFQGAGLATVNDNTVFTIRTGSLVAGYTYTQYVGKENVPTYKDAEVFYTDANGDGFVDYVYVKNGIADNSTNNFVMATANTYYNYLYNNQNVYGVYQALVNGEAIADPLLADADKYNEFIKLFDKENDHFQPYYVTYDAAGHIATVNAFTGRSQVAGNEWYVKLNVTACDGTTLIHNDSALAAGRYNISSAAVYGDYTKEQIMDVRWDEVDVYAVYTKVGEYRVVTQLYIMDKGMGGNTPEGPGAEDKTTVTYQVNFYDSNKSTVQSTLEKTVDIDAGTYRFGVEYTAAGLLAAVGADAASWSTSYCTPSITVTTGNQYVIVLNVYPSTPAAPVNP